MDMHEDYTGADGGAGGQEAAWAGPSVEVDDCVAPGIGGITPGGVMPPGPMPGGPAPGLAPGRGANLHELMPNGPMPATRESGAAKPASKPRVVVPSRPSHHPLAGVWQPRPRLSATLVPLFLCFAGAGLAGYLYRFVGTIPMAALAGTLSLVAALFCRVLLRE